MQIDNEFSLPMPTDQAFALLTDIERIAPCMPGAKLTGVEGDEYSGTVKVKVGPITARYKGTASLVEADALAGRAVLEATGRESRGQGSASATITATLDARGPSDTTVRLTTDLQITGKVAQVGRGVMADVSAKLLGQFVECLQSQLVPAPAAGAPAADAEAGEPTADSQAGEPAADAPVEEPAARDEPAAREPAAGDTPDADESPDPVQADEAGDDDVEAIDLLDAAGASVAKRVAPVVAVTALVVLIVRRRRRKRRRLLGAGTT